MSVDVLTLTIALGTRYPSKNHEGRDGMRTGRKSEEYRKLFEDIKEAAEREMARTGWNMAECECLTIVVRYMPNHLRADALNLAGCEANALTAAGVWTDDRLAQPVTLHIRYDDEGPHRVTIVVMKLYEPANVRIVAKPEKLRKAPKLSETSETIANRSRNSGNLEKPLPERVRYMGGPIPKDMALFGDQLISKSEALAMIAKKAS